MRKYLIIAAAIALAGCVSTTSQPGMRLDPSLAPTFGEVGLQAGSQIAVAIDAGGHIEIRDYGANCGGFVYDRPDYAVNFQTNGNATLTFSVTSAADTTLAIYTPAGTWVCDNNSGGSLNPLVRIASAQPGAYRIWVGTEENNGTFPASTLRIY